MREKREVVDNNKKYFIAALLLSSNTLYQNMKVRIQFRKY